ncbi:hypothetical protein [Amycolatopsis sp. NPDC059657]|uniref:hypothetical protein n=1 Tax=Amycolatopsis sp. NPDC059657 TaxID=3346899 RepID=UPI00366C3681
MATDPLAVPEFEAPLLPSVPLEPASFDNDRLRRTVDYRHVSARRAVIVVGPYAELRDAVLHAARCCLPDMTLFAEGVDRLLVPPPISRRLPVVVDAKERGQLYKKHIFDVSVRTLSGKLVEYWEGLRLRVLREGHAGLWAPPLLGAYLERALERLLGGSHKVAVEPDPANVDGFAVVDERVQAGLAIGRALGTPVDVRYRQDGRPKLPGAEVATARAMGLTLAVVADEPIACALEPAEPGVTGWDTQLAAAVTCLAELGMTGKPEIVEVHPDGWALWRAGDGYAATWVTPVDSRAKSAVFAVGSVRQSVP